MKPWARIAATVAAGLLLLLGLGVSAIRVGAFESRGLLGIDYRLMMELGDRWRETGSIYAAYQLAGPYRFDVASGTTNVDAMPALYPPIVGPMFAIVGVLPAVLWWAVPLGVLTYAFARWRPARWTWPLFAALLVWPVPASVLAVGGTTMWVTAAVAGGLLWGWPAVLIALKPSLAPFMLVGVRSRSWWIGLVVLGAVSVLMLPEWLRYVTVIRNAQSSGLAYSVGDIPLLLAPVLAWAARTTQRHERAGSVGFNLEPAAASPK